MKEEEETKTCAAEIQKSEAGIRQGLKAAPLNRFRILTARHCSSTVSSTGWNSTGGCWSAPLMTRLLSWSS